MLIGEDFDKLKWYFSGFEFLEPNALIGDTLLLIVALFYAYKTFKLKNKNFFYSYWTLFFILFGISFFVGGLGHFCYNYWGVRGKYFSWFAGIFSTFILELAMIEIYPKSTLKLFLKRIAIVKLFVFVLLEVYVLDQYNIEANPHLGLFVPTLNSFIGLGLTLGVLSIYYQRKIANSFRFFWMSALILLPTVIIQGLKINLHPYFDRNDFSHLLLIISLVYYFKALQGIDKDLMGRSIRVN